MAMLLLKMAPVQKQPSLDGLLLSCYLVAEASSS